MRTINRLTTLALAATLLAATTLGAAAQSPAPDPMAPAHVTGRFIFDGDQTVNATITTEDGVTRYRGGETWTGLTIEASDPRLAGKMTSTFDRDVYPGSVGVAWGTSTITNDAGSWSGPFVLPITAPGWTWRGASHYTGSGAYEGLSVLMLQEAGGSSFEAVILPGPIPPVE